MTKIAHEAPDTGTGSITFKAPPTNNDRVLGLPDETGTLASQGYVDAAEQAAKDYSGTVSGIGRSWQDVKGSRSAGITYTNTTGRDIYIAITASAPSDIGAQVRILIDGSYVIQQLSDSAIFNYASVCFPVPDGSTYELSDVNNNIDSWSELR